MLRKFWSRIVGLMFVLAATVPLAEGISAYRLDIPAQPVAQALQSFAEQSGLQVVYYAKFVEGRIANPVKGTLSTSEALHRLLANTGLTFQEVDKRTIGIREAALSTTGENTQDAESLKLVQASAQAEGESAPGTQPASSQSPAAPAGNDARSIQEIVVTAQKREERLQDVPISISVLTGETLEKRGFVSLGDFLRNVPGVNFTEFGLGSNYITIRGISGGSEATGVYLGEMPLTAMGAPIGTFNSPDLKLVDMERVEVLRGPQGTLYGAGSMGGNLRYIPNAPNLQSFEGDIGIDYAHTGRAGSNNKSVTGAFNIPLVSDTLALRLTGYHFDNGGYVTYIGDADPVRAAFAAATGATIQVGENGGASEYTGGRASLLWKPRDNFSATFTYVNQQTSQDGFLWGTVGLPAYHDFPLLFTNLTSRGTEERHSDSQLANLTLNYEMPLWTFVSSTSRSEQDGGEVRSASRELPSPLGVIATGDTRATTQELRIRSKFSKPFNFLIGGFYENNEFSGTQQVVWQGAPSLCCSYGPFPTLFGTDPDDLGSRRDINAVEQKALFAELYYDITQQLKLTVGGRYFDYSRTIGQVASGATQGNVNTQIRNSESGESLKANMAYSITDSHMVYVQWAQGFKLGRPVVPPPVATCDQNNDGILDGTNARIDTTSLESENVDSWELGGKSTWMDGRMALNAAIYRVLWKNIPTSSSLGTCGFSVPIAAGEARSQGFEVDGTLALTARLLLNFSAAVIDAEITRAATSLGAGVGAEVPVSPFQGNIGLEYQFNLMGYSSYVRGDYGYVGEYYGNYQQFGPELSGYRKLDLSTGIEVKQFNAALYGTNLTNEAPLVFFAQPLTTYLQPRTIGIRVGYRFD